jgi:hypothetical protein
MQKLQHIILVALTVLLVPGSALAFDWGEAYNKALTGSTYYDPNDICGGNGQVPTENVGGATGGTPAGDNAVVAYKFFVSKGLAPFRAAAIIGNFMQESHVNPKEGNPAAKAGGGGIAQWEGDRWSGPNGLNAFASGTGNFTSNGRQGVWNDLMVQLNFVWWEMNHNKVSALKTLKNSANIDDATSNFELNYEGAGIPMMNNRKMYARQVLADPRMGNGAPDSGTVDGTPTQGLGGAGGGTGPGPTPPACADPAGASGAPGAPGNATGIVGTALSDLAWPKPDCFQQAFGTTRGNCYVSTPRYAAVGGTHTNPGGNDAFTDCGTFVATVMHVSGADPKYPPVQTTTQRSYVQSHPALYHITPHPTNTGQLHEGDILIEDNHTMIYVGAKGGNLTRVDASWHDHTPQRNTAGGVQWMFSQPGIVAATYLGPAK